MIPHGPILIEILGDFLKYLGLNKFCSQKQS